MRSIDSMPNAYLPFLDGLRAIAILSVLIFHLHSDWLPSGFVGVDVFFVVSGFVISASLYRHPPAGFTPWLKAFLTRRFWRIFPALCVCISLIALLSLWLIPASELSALNRLTGLSAVFGLSNFVLAYYDTDSLNPIIEYTLYTPTWSLGVETQFYLLIPLLLFTPRLRLVLIGGGLFLSVIISWYLSLHHPSAAYYLLPSRLWELLLGTAVFLLLHHLPSRPSPRTLSYIIWSGLIFLGLGFVYSSPLAFPFPNALATTVGTALLIFGLMLNQEHHWVASLLSTPAVTALGKISYSLYLWHWPIFCLYRWNLGLNTPWQQFSAVCLSLVAAVISYRWIEQRWRVSAHLRA